MLFWLVENPSASDFDIEKNLKAHNFATCQVVKDLLKRGLLKSKSDSRATRIYYPSFKGFLVYFALNLPPDILNSESIQKSYAENWKKIRRAILNIKKLYPESRILAEWNTIEEWLGKVSSYYQLCATSAYTLNSFPFEENHQKRSKLFSSPKDEIIREIIKTEKLCRKISETDYFWISSFEDAFAYPYIELLLSNKVIEDYLKGRSIPNEKLCNLFQEIIDSKIRIAEDRIQKLIFMKKAFKALFCSSEKSEEIDFKKVKDRNSTAIKSL